MGKKKKANSSMSGDASVASADNLQKVVKELDVFDVADGEVTGVVSKESAGRSSSVEAQLCMNPSDMALLGSRVGLNSVVRLDMTGETRLPTLPARVQVVKKLSRGKFALSAPWNQHWGSRGAVRVTGLTKSEHVSEVKSVSIRFNDGQPPWWDEVASRRNIFILLLRKSLRNAYVPRIFPFGLSFEGSLVHLTVRKGPFLWSFLTEWKGEVTAKESDVELMEMVCYLPDGIKIVFKSPRDVGVDEGGNSRFQRIGGLESTLSDIRNILDVVESGSLKLRNSKFAPPRGMLLYGLSGVGKTSILKAFFESWKGFKVYFSSLDFSASDQGAGERKLRDAFRAAFSSEEHGLLLIDNLESFGKKRDGNVSDSEKRLLSTFLSLMDGVSREVKPTGIILMAATVDPFLLDPALRRPGRFEYEIEIPVPTREMRKDILRVILREYNHTLTDVDLDAVVAKTHGFVGADLVILCKEAEIRIMMRNDFRATDAALDVSALLETTRDILPSGLRDIAIEVPQVRWVDIGGQEDIKQVLREVAEWPLLHPEAFARMGIQPPRGVLLYGPPGCSKTLMAKALATESDMNFLAVKGPELLSKYLGESERALQRLFQKARAAQPSIIFFDEIDAIASSRRYDADSGNSATERLLSQLLVEIDGINISKSVVVVAATNRPDILDQALIRPGRIDRLVYVSPPDFGGRKAIFSIALKNMPILDEMDYDELSRLSEGFSGAEIVGACREAALTVMIEQGESAIGLTMKDITSAVERVSPRISKDMIEFYENFAKGQKGQKGQK